MDTDTESMCVAEDKPPGHSEAKDDWRRQLRNSVKDIKGLKEKFLLKEEDIDTLLGVIKDFPFSITPYYLSLIDRGNVNDPVRLQCMPSEKEIALHLELQDDPLGEEKGRCFS